MVGGGGWMVGGGGGGGGGVPVRTFTHPPAKSLAVTLPPAIAALPALKVCNTLQMAWLHAVHCSSSRIVRTGKGGGGREVDGGRVTEGNGKKKSAK